MHRRQRLLEEHLLQQLLGGMWRRRCLRCLIVACRCYNGASARSCRFAAQPIELSDETEGAGVMDEVKTKGV